MRYTDAAYQGAKGGPLDVDRDLYRSIADGPTEIIDEFVIPIRSGTAWEVRQGDLCRVVSMGPQVGDLNIWNRHNPRERMWAAKTRQLHAAHVTTYDRLWSNLPYLRPLVTITGDTLSRYGTDEDGGRVHDLLGTRCDPYTNTLLTGDDFDFHCHSNLVRAIAGWGLDERDVHDVLNVFQVTGLNDNDEYFMKPCPAQEGDYLELFAEQDLLCALSTCPGGDLSIPMWGPDAADPIDVCRPIRIQVLRPDPERLAAWTAPQLRQYKGLNGMTVKDWATEGNS